MHGRRIVFSNCFVQSVLRTDARAVRLDDTFFQQVRLRMTSTTTRTASRSLYLCLALLTATLMAGCGPSGDTSSAEKGSGAEESQFGGGDATAQQDAASDGRSSSTDGATKASPSAVDGATVYQRNCQSCHGPDGAGRAAFPPLQNSEWVTGDRGRLIRLVLHGVKGEMEVGGRTYNAAMAGMDYLSDEQTAAVLTHVRTSFGNDASDVTADQVAAVRQSVQRDRSWPASELKTETGIP